MLARKRFGRDVKKVSEELVMEKEWSVLVEESDRIVTVR